jgi:hypothetical protein
MKTVLSKFLAGTLLALVAATAYAQAKSDPCKADFEKYCPGVKPGGGAVSACYKQNESKFSPECKQALAALDAFARACGNDVKTHCPGVKAGEGRIERCLKQHESQLSQSCKQFRGAVKDKVETAALACEGDIKTHCASVQPGGGRILNCLKQHEAALTPACKGQLTPARR